MALSIGTPSGKTVTPQMNVTPLVDVVLVLLIIFLVVTPLLSKNFWVHLPKQEKEEVDQEDLKQDPDPPLVLRVGPNRAIQVNGVGSSACSPRATTTSCSSTPATTRTTASRSRSSTRRARAAR
jgi:biopolymer transport protein ExbD